VAEVLAELAFEEATGHGGVLEDVFHGAAVEGAFADEAECGGDGGVVDGQDIGGLSGLDADGFDAQGFVGRGFAGHHAVEEGGGLVSDALGVGHDAGERGVTEVTKDGVVVDADDGDFFGDGAVEAEAGVEDVLATHVAAGHETDGEGEGGEPAGDLCLFAFPGLLAGAGPGGFPDFASPAAFGESAYEAFAAGDGEGLTGEAAEGEVTEAAFEKMVGGEDADGAVVGFDARRAQGRAAIIQIDQWNLGAVEHLRHLGRGLAADDAVAAPLAQPGWGGGPELALFEEDGPALVGAEVARDAAQDLPTVVNRRLDDQSHMRPFGHFIPRPARLRSSPP